MSDSDYYFKKSDIVFSDFSWLTGVLALIAILALAAGIVMMMSYERSEQAYKVGKSMTIVAAAPIGLILLMIAVSYLMYLYAHNED